MSTQVSRGQQRDDDDEATEDVLGEVVKAARDTHTDQNVLTLSSRDELYKKAKKRRSIFERMEELTISGGGDGPRTVSMRKKNEKEQTAPETESLTYGIPTGVGRGRGRRKFASKGDFPLASNFGNLLALFFLIPDPLPGPGHISNRRCFQSSDSDSSSHTEATTETRRRRANVKTEASSNLATTSDINWTDHRDVRLESRNSLETSYLPVRPSGAPIAPEAKKKKASSRELLQQSRESRNPVAVAQLDTSLPPPVFRNPPPPIVPKPCGSLELETYGKYRPMENGSHFCRGNNSANNSYRQEWSSRPSKIHDDSRPKRFQTSASRREERISQNSNKITEEGPISSTISSFGFGRGSKLRPEDLMPSSDASRPSTSPSTNFNFKNAPNHETKENSSLDDSFATAEGVMLTSSNHSSDLKTELNGDNQNNCNAESAVSHQSDDDMFQVKAKKVLAPAKPAEKVPSKSAQGIIEEFKLQAATVTRPPQDVKKQSQSQIQKLKALRVKKKSSSPSSIYSSTATDEEKNDLDRNDKKANSLLVKLPPVPVCSNVLVHKEGRRNVRPIEAVSELDDINPKLAHVARAKTVSNLAKGKSVTEEGFFIFAPHCFFFP